MKKNNLIVFGIILLSFLVGGYFYNQMPDQMASHWNTLGEVDGYMSKFWGLFLMPLISFGLFIMFLIIPFIDPLKENIEKFRKYFDSFIFFIILFLFYIYILTIIWNFGFKFDMGYATIPALSTLFYLSGILISKAEKNWFIGIRNPWTLSNDEVWKKTHKIGGKLFKLSAVIILLSLIKISLAFYFIFIPIILSVIYLTIYSYFEFQKQKGLESK